MKIPTATYRIQFRNGMTFDDATAIIPYLKRLGISHLYASPIFTATTGSTHGYDVTNANEIDPAIGGRAGFNRMVAKLKTEGLGLILDIVPNHMAASLENPWWRDVIEHGEKSRYARHFDIDWSRRLTLPVLGKDFNEALNDGEINVERDEESGKPVLAYFESLFPLAPASYAGREEELVRSSDKQLISELHDRQFYRLMCWRDAKRDLSYRRFFEVTGLAGVRVEDDAVFDDTHRLILELVKEGSVEGLRVDHIDGLADPKAYLDRLRHEVGDDCHITVEKILGEGEQLPSDWPVSGTTGYEFIAALSHLFTDDRKLGNLQSAYEAAQGGAIDARKELRKAKLLMVDHNFAGEFSTLCGLAMEILQAGEDEPEADDTRSALRELLVSFPVYRTYGTNEGLPKESDEMLAKVIDFARHNGEAPDARAFESLQRILRGEIPSDVKETADEFRTRFQQLTGPLMAKSVEDTLFYRQNTALALNEVGAEPLPHPYSLQQFHRQMALRLETQPDALSTTSTHDTKRGEDARARLYTITEAPDVWNAAFERWRDLNASSRKQIDGGIAPEAPVEWMLYQALLGVWPNDLRISDKDGLKALEDRFISYVEKALREAKLRTNWGDSNEEYEAAVLAYAKRLVDPANDLFLSDFAETTTPFVTAGLYNSFSQTLIKLTAPGVPDIYQGSEGLDLSLVDPDNRRTPDYAAFEQQLSDTNPQPEIENWPSPSSKQTIIQQALCLRQEMPQLFRSGEYIALNAINDGAEHVIAFGRRTEDEAIMVIAPRLTFSNSKNGLLYREARIKLPKELAGTYIDVLTGTQWTLRGDFAVSEVTGAKHMALLRRLS